MVLSSSQRVFARFCTMRTEEAACAYPGLFNKRAESVICLQMVWQQAGQLAQRVLREHELALVREIDLGHILLLDALLVSVKQEKVYLIKGVSEDGTDLAKTRLETLVGPIHLMDLDQREHMADVAEGFMDSFDGLVETMEGFRPVSLFSEAFRFEAQLRQKLRAFYRHNVAVNRFFLQ